MYVTTKTDHAAVKLFSLGLLNLSEKHAWWWSKVYGSDIRRVELVHRAGTPLIGGHKNIDPGNIPGCLKDSEGNTLSCPEGNTQEYLVAHRILSFSMRQLLPQVLKNYQHADAFSHQLVAPTPAKPVDIEVQIVTISTDVHSCILIANL